MKLQILITNAEKEKAEQRYGITDGGEVITAIDGVVSERLSTAIKNFVSRSRNNKDVPLQNPTIDGQEYALGIDLITIDSEARAYRLNFTALQSNMVVTAYQIVVADPEAEITENVSDALTFFNGKLSALTLGQVAEIFEGLYTT